MIELPQQYIQKAVVVEAVCWDGTEQGAEVVVEWCSRKRYAARHARHWPEPAVCVMVGVSEVCVHRGQYLVYGSGTFSVREHEIFWRSYEAFEMPTATEPTPVQLRLLDDSDLAKL